jgi:hypothetical protein
MRKFLFSAVAAAALALAATPRTGASELSQLLHRYVEGGYIVGYPAQYVVPSYTYYGPGYTYYEPTTYYAPLYTPYVYYSTPYYYAGPYVTFYGGWGRPWYGGYYRSWYGGRGWRWGGWHWRR